jgi:DNA repair exonuclease SbcCD ATPase subunit
MITYLKMVNWRAYTEHEIKFKQGITFLMGANGSGKTSILEAIAYALTGEVSFLAKGERSNILKNPNKPGIVTLEIAINNSEYEIVRTQNPGIAGDAKITRKGDNKVIAQSHLRVTKKVSELLGISDDFLRRIIYMAEGDVFNFLNDPPKDALDNQIRSVLGLTQLNEFSDALKASEKFFKSRLKSLQDLNGDLIRSEVRSMEELDNKLKGGNVAREQFLSQLEEMGHELGAFEQKAKSILDLQGYIGRLKDSIKTSPSLWMDFENNTVGDYFTHLQSEAHKAEDRHTEIRLGLARLDGQEEAYKKVISLLEPFENSDETVPCPVCRKPITKSERKTIIEEIKQDVEQLNNDRKDQIRDREKAAQDVKQLDDQITQIGPLRNVLAHTELTGLPSINLFQSFENLDKSVSDLAQGLQGSKSMELSQQRDEIRQRIKELEGYTAEYQAVKKRLQDVGFNSPEDLVNELVQIEVRMLSLRAASQAIEGTLQSQQNTDMKIIYEQIADLWSSFRGDEGWAMEYGSNGYPVMTKGDEETKLDLRQLSGGEKTALLIQLHTIMAHHFSKSDFLMIDEPLEHLDPVNRRSLIKFLVDAYHHKIFGQAIIATFEESLIRKYQSNEGINIILV